MLSISDEFTKGRRLLAFGRSPLSVLPSNVFVASVVHFSQVFVKLAPDGLFNNYANFLNRTKFLLLR
ncbi:hypothetical protein AYK26_00920 [Euryarchaeota archaeon SM23-78]|nr:MAG: hypothetical protein AYK26_00920 [Euryarchaeota archaeon SM23-78]